MSVKGQDIMVLLKVLVKEGEDWTYQQLADELCMSSSEVHAALKRALKANLVDHNKQHVNKSNLLEFIIHGLKYVFPAELGSQTRGIPTAYSHIQFSKQMSQGDDLPIVWSHPEGDVKGISLKPLYRSEPEAALRDKELYFLLVLVDMIRIGNARERKIAEKEFRKVLE